jgi:hypothetical protein
MSTLDKLSRTDRAEMLNSVDPNRSVSESTQESEEFCRIHEGLFEVVVCTSLTDEEATERVNLVPSGTVGGWKLFTGPGVSQRPCDTDPGTHRHIAFEC